MAPRKEPLSRDGADLARLIEKYDIHFKGPVPPGEWPKHLQFEGEPRHRFSVFREIWSNRYENLRRKREAGVDARSDNIKARADELRRRALKLRDNLNTNESTWRANIEQIVFDRFLKDVICRRHCGGEIHESNYEAEPLTANARDQLRHKRLQRMQCDIRQRAVRFSSKDREREPIFNDENEHNIEHEEDEVELRNRSGVSMKPDKVFGLTSQHQNDLSWNPVKGIRMICPFIIVEAKKESRTPGFRSVERQTAFPIRRFLRLQARVLESSTITNEPPLVWFFANQGEEWRLYAGTLETKKKSRTSYMTGADSEGLGQFQVCVYDLWHGTIESQDGALQLLQIVDHIWTWARDIYRPGMMACLQGLDNRESSPASTVQFYGTPSVRSESVFLSSARVLNNPSSARLQSEEQVDCSTPAYNTEPVDPSRRPQDLQSITVDLTNDEQNDRLEAQPDSIDDSQTPNDAPEGASTPTYPILIWADLHLASSEFSTFATVCHANIVRFTFCLRDITDFEAYLSSESSEYTRRERWKLMDIYQISTQASRSTLSRLGSYWTQRNCEETIPLSDEIVRTTIFFHTYFHQTTWHIVREIVCVIWPTEIVNEDGEPLRLSSHTQLDLVVSYDTLIQEVQPLQQLSGYQSVLCAHRSYTLLPSFGKLSESENLDAQYILWETPGGIFPSSVQLKACIELLRDEPLFASSKNGMHLIDTGPIILSKTAADVSGTLPGLPEPMTEAMSLIAMKPTSWPLQSAKFCLFVLWSFEIETVERLSVLLEDAVRREYMIGHRPEFLLTRDERTEINRWAGWLRSLQ